MGKVSKTAKIRNQYNQVPHLTQDTTSESDKISIRHHNNYCIHVVYICNNLYNYNCHNIYWDPLIWLVKNGHLIALTCISFFNEPGPYSWGAGPFTTELLLWYWMLLWREMDSVQLLTLYLTLTPIFSGRKAKINLHTTPRLTVVMPISCLLPCADPGIFVRGWGGGSTSIGQKKLWQRCFFGFFLSPQLIFWSQMVNFKEKYHFSSFRRGSKFVQGRRGGGSNFFQGRGGRIAYSL